MKTCCHLHLNQRCVRDTHRRNCDDRRTFGRHSHHPWYRSLPASAIQSTGRLLFSGHHNILSTTALHYSDCLRPCEPDGEATRHTTDA